MRVAGALIASAALLGGAFAPVTASAAPRPGPPAFEAGEAAGVGATASPSITIIQDSVADAPQDFTYTGCAGVQCGPFVLDDDSDPTLSNTGTAEGLLPGTYTVTQAPTAGWVLDDINCDTLEQVDLANGRVTITLVAGEDVTCTFLNRSPSITIVQDAIPNSGQDLAFTGCLGASCGSFSLDDDADSPLPDRVTAVALAPATYTITQAADGRWPLTALTCNTNELVELDQRRITITLGVDEHTICTFTNRTQGITIEQDTSPDGDGHDFGYEGCLGVGCSTFSLDDDTDPTLTASLQAPSVPAGTYTITQDPDAGYSLVGLSCDPAQAVDLAAGRVTIVLTAGQQIRCTFSNEPRADALDGVASISASRTGSCAAMTDGTARCWGDNGDGQLGRLGGDSTVPVVVEDEAGTGALDDVAMISTAYTTAQNGTAGSTCAVLTSGQARCWGANNNAQVGDGSATSADRSRPVIVVHQGGTPFSGAGEISAGGYHTCARVTAQVRCWGRGGSIGNGSTTNNTAFFPTVVVNPDNTGPLTRVVQIDSGSGYTCAALTTGQARCWGVNAEGSLGDGSSTDRNLPVVVTNGDGTGPLTEVAEVHAAERHTCARLDSGEARCWGSNGHGQLGDGTGTARPRPVPVSNPEGTGPLTGVAEIATGGFYSSNSPSLRRGVTCARLTNDQVRCWGSNDDGQLGDGTRTSRSRPVTVLNPEGTGPLSGVTELAVASGHACARLEDLRVVCWGDNALGQLGDGTTNDHLLPTYVVEP